MKKRVFWSIILSSILILISTSALIIFTLYKDYESERKNELMTECSYISAALENSEIKSLNSIGSYGTNRITLVASDGAVLYDNFSDPETMENHLDRPEISEALKNGSGEASRLSDTLGENTYYYAKRLDNGDVLRVSITTKSIYGLINNSIGIILFILLIAVTSATVSASFLTKAIVSPINNLNLDDPLSNNTYDELSSLLLRMDKQNKKISEQISELKEKQNEFDTMTGNMNEALVIFGENQYILSANKSAVKLFGSNKTKGISYLELCRDPGYTRSVKSAFSGKPANDKITRNGRVYQLSVTPVKGEKSFAAVLFAVDITEKEQNEQMRREFSANVSHELKTPLTLIMGCAEIMQNGIAKEEDYPHFIEQIYFESKRLLSLIEDIIKLSRLDEQDVKDEFKPVNLYVLSEKVLSELKDKAESYKVSLLLEGENIEIKGIERTLHEMIYNLCDNAITYNRPQGNVIISISKSDDHVILTVKDTGIGIAPEHQTRVFERFYRVDKSRSKDTGGTGLGLSIVKHAAMLHNAKIEMNSSIGVGTEITIKF